MIPRKCISKPIKVYVREWTGNEKLTWFYFNLEYIKIKYTHTHLHISFDPKILLGNILEDLHAKIIQTLKCQRVVKP